jgi:hypothetical protein
VAIVNAVFGELFIESFMAVRSNRCEDLGPPADSVSSGVRSLRSGCHFGEGVMLYVRLRSIPGPGHRSAHPGHPTHCLSSTARMDAALRSEITLIITPACVTMSIGGNMTRKFGLEITKPRFGPKNSNLFYSDISQVLIALRLAWS